MIVAKGACNRHVKLQKDKQRGAIRNTCRLCERYDFQRLGNELPQSGFDMKFALREKKGKGEVTQTIRAKLAAKAVTKCCN